MIKYLQIKEHKGVRLIRLENLGHLNIICGKNNSGKSSILEGIANKNTRTLGIFFNEHRDKLLEEFSKSVSTYTQPSAESIQTWLINYIDENLNQEIVVYLDDFLTVLNPMGEAWRTHYYLKQYDPFVLNIVDQILRRIINKIECNPILIPPKRIIQLDTSVDVDSNINPQGYGVTNRLIKLKTQNPDSKDFEIYESIQKSFYEITESRFNVSIEANNKIKLYFLSNDKWINADSCGLGLSDVLILVTHILSGNNNFLLIEEPENHLHPDMQRRLLNFFLNQTDKQFILSTHSSVFIDTQRAAKIFYSHYGSEVQITDETSKSEILFNLGYSVSDNILADIVVITEGKYDIPVLSTICEWLDLSNNYNIKYWNVGGDLMADLDLTVFAERKNVIALIDDDKGSSKSRTRFKRNCESLGIYCHRLKRKAIENYFTLEALKKVFPKDIPKEISAIDSNENVDKQLGFGERDGSPNSIKSKNYQIIKNMSLRDIEDTDLLEFCLKIKVLCKQSKEKDK